VNHAQDARATTQEERKVNNLRYKMKQFTEDKVDATAALKGGISGALPETVEPPEIRQAKELASRYRLPFVNLCRKRANRQSTIRCSASCRLT